METRQIANEEDYQLILKRIDEIFDASPGSAEEQELELLVLTINKYEAENYPIG